MTKIGIVGCRDRKDKSRVKSVVKSLSELCDDLHIVSGGARGPDSWAIEEAKNWGIPSTVHFSRIPAGHAPKYLVARALYERNQRIVDDIDVLIAFVSPERKGETEDTIKKALLKKVKIIIIDQEGKCLKK